MKRFLTIIICLLLMGASIYKLPTITDKISSYFYSTQKVVLTDKNFYAKDANYKYVSITDDFVPYNFQELINIFYTVLDYGYETFTFYCPVEYQDCLDDVNKISDSNSLDILTTLGNFVSPFNNFKTLKVQYDTAGEVTIITERIYSDEDIRKINAKLDDLWNLLVTSEMDKEDIIYAFHDYFINNTKYDQAYEEELKTGTTTHDSSKANGVLFEGYAICSGYTDAMALVLDRLKIPNFKVASSTHVWNVLYLNDAWVHLDLTWDDPVDNPNDGGYAKDILLHKFYLINTETLEEFDIEDHTFNKSIYLELK
ncbi:MAG: transglutaminase domain-containing protein [Erysipelotrichales bacterium]|nr:transglutaminase domain-containing protein [Erysipelotrichales bacterium]